MFIHNTDVATVFSQIADLLEIKGDNPFRIRAYRNAARTLNTLAASVQTMVEEQRNLKDLPGIGDDLAGKIVEIANTGTCVLREKLRCELPPAIHELLTVPGLGPKRVKTLYQERNIQTLEQLYRAARDGQISHVPGFGRRVEQRILETEDSVFNAVGLPYIEPELRENRGEMTAAQAGRLPVLVELGDLTGDLHAHTKATTDGQNSLREMALEAKRRGFAYLGITEHSSRLTVAHASSGMRNSAVAF